MYVVGEQSARQHGVQRVSTESDAVVHSQPPEVQNHHVSRLMVIESVMPPTFSTF